MPVQGITQFTALASAPPIGKRQRFRLLKTQLLNERSSFEAHWRDLSEYIVPHRSRFLVNDTHRGRRQNLRIMDGTATYAHRTLRSGMQAGITSPARPWFRLSTPDLALNEIGSVKAWLHTVTVLMRSVFLKSNLYNSLPVLYGDVGAFGTSAMFVEEDFDNVIHTRVFPVGSYMLGVNHKGKIKLFYREFQLTVRQIVEWFGRLPGSDEINWDNISLDTRLMWENGHTETLVDVDHVVEENPEWNPDALESRFKRYRSTYFEVGRSGPNRTHTPKEDLEFSDKILRERGYDFFPVLCPRWAVNGEDAYGTNCPGMDALGDIKGLQLMEKRNAQAIEKMVNPPMQAPVSLKGERPSILPGDITYVNTREGQQGFRAAHEIRFAIRELEEKEMQARQRVRVAFYENLFLMLANSDRREITAREVDERHEEKLLALGPVLEQLNTDLLEPLIDITFNFMLRQGQIPEPPQELEGVTLKVEYESILAQAQKLAGLASLDRYAQFGAQLSTFVPTVLDKMDADQLMDEYADITGVPPQVTRSDEQVDEIRAQRAQAEAAQAQLQAAEQASKAAKDLSKAEMERDNVLTRLTDAAQAGQIARQ